MNIKLNSNQSKANASSNDHKQYLNGRYQNKIVELYRALLPTLAPSSTFQETLDVLSSLGYFAGRSTRIDLQAIYEGKRGPNKSAYSLMKDYDMPSGIVEVPLEILPVVVRSQVELSGLVIPIIVHEYYANVENLGVCWHGPREIHISTCPAWREVLEHELAHSFIWDVSRRLTLAADEEVQAESMARYHRWLNAAWPKLSKDLETVIEPYAERAHNSRPPRWFKADDTSKPTGEIFLDTADLVRQAEHRGVGVNGRNPIDWAALEHAEMVMETLDVIGCLALQDISTWAKVADAYYQSPIYEDALKVFLAQREEVQKTTIEAWNAKQAAKGRKPLDIKTLITELDLVSKVPQYQDRRRAWNTN